MVRRFSNLPVTHHEGMNPLTAPATVSLEYLTQECGNNMSKTLEDKWGDEIERWTPRRVKTWAWVLIIAVILLPAAAWGISVATSGPRGAGDVVRQRNDADNRISAQAFFEDTYATIKAQDLKLTEAQATLDDFLATTPQPSSSDMVQVQLYTQQLKAKQTTVTGLQQICQDAVASYNAEARKTIRAEWRAEDLPYQIDATSTTSETDCQPAA